MKNGVIFVSGIHGVGKTTLCSDLSSALSIPHLSASKIIKDYRNRNQNISKLNAEVMSNAAAFRSATIELLKSNDRLIIDGHTVLLNEKGSFVRVPFDIFKGLPILSFITLYNDIPVLQARLEGQIPNSIEYLSGFQDLELSHSAQITRQCGFDMCYFHSNQSVENIQEFVLLKLGDSGTETQGI